MKRDRCYIRSQRKRTIRKKKDLLYRIGGQEYWWAWTHGNDGRLAKGKIHCSCPMCRSKSYDDPTVWDKRTAEKAKDMVSEHFREEAISHERNDSQKAQ